MSKMTSANANKLIRRLKEDRLFLTTKERNNCTYDVSADEEPVIPEYDFEKVNEEIAEIDAKVLKIKHAINLNNVINRIAVGDEMMSIDEILVYMAQLSNRKAVLDFLRKNEPKTRIGQGVYTARKTTPEYRYINYDLDLIKREYEIVDEKIAQMQMALDYYNQTFEFEVDI